MAPMSPERPVTLRMVLGHVARMLLGHVTLVTLGHVTYAPRSRHAFNAGSCYTYAPRSRHVFTSCMLLGHVA
eukprot:2228795-Rhodomonas_salina.3